MVMKMWRSGLVGLAIVLSGCMTVPPEVVQLSSITATDTRALHDGYRALVRKHFTALRKTREQEFADKILAPFIEDALTEGRLVDVVQGKVVWDGAQGAFVAPDPARATVQKLDSIANWNREVSAGISDLRKDAFADLDALENKVIDEVDRAFGNVERGNATIHAYLLSLQKVQAAQDEVLKGMGLADLPRKLNDALDKASQDAAAWSAKADKTTRKVSTLKEQLNKAKGK